MSETVDWRSTNHTYATEYLFGHCSEFNVNTIISYKMNMMTAKNGNNISRITGPLCGEFTGGRWLPLTKASDANIWYFLCSAPQQTVNNRDAGDLRRHRAHYDVIVMNMIMLYCHFTYWHMITKHVHPSKPGYHKPRVNISVGPVLVRLVTGGLEAK